MIVEWHWTMQYMRLNLQDTGEDGTATCYQCGEGFLRLIRCRVCGKSIHTPKCVYNETNGDMIVTATSLRFVTIFWSEIKQFQLILRIVFSIEHDLSGWT